MNQSELEAKHVTGAKRGKTRKNMGSIPVEEADLFFVKRLWHTEYYMFL